MGERSIRALYDNESIVVYQAYNNLIASTAVKHQAFVYSFFKRDRMTWVKPSFLWMMYRSGWATKKNQEHILSIRIKREGFEWALQNACLSHFDSNIFSTHEEWKRQLSQSPVRIQWDPEKNILLNNLEYRSIQMGLSGIAVEKYVSEWILEITDITTECKNIHRLVSTEKIDEAIKFLPKEVLYKVNNKLGRKINATD